MTSNGKGSQRRGAGPASRKRYADGWDRVFKVKRDADRLERKLLLDLHLALSDIASGKVKTATHADVVKSIGNKRVPKLKPYPNWCCYACGIKASGGRVLNEYATYHYGTCPVCGGGGPVTEPRDFRYPRFAGHAFGP